MSDKKFYTNGVPIVLHWYYLLLLISLSSKIVILIQQEYCPVQTSNAGTQHELPRFCVLVHRSKRPLLQEA